MTRLLPVSATLFVVGGLLFGLLGLRNLAILAQIGVSPRTPAGASGAGPPPPTLTAADRRPAPTVDAASRPTASTPVVAAGVPWSFLYVISGDIWEISLGEATQLTQNGQLGQPALGDSGLGFIERQRNTSDLWLAAPGGPPEPITRDASTIISQNRWASQPVFLPGRQRAYILGDFNKTTTGVGDLAVWELSLADGAVVQITRPPGYGGGDQDVTVNPHNPQQIIFTRYGYAGNQLVEQLQWLDVAGDTAVPLTQADQPARQASYSPDGTKVAFVQGGDGSHENLYVGSLTVTRGQPQLDGVREVATGVIANPVWTPDGNGLAYIALTNEQFQLWFVDIRRAGDGTEAFGQPRQITTGASVDATSRPVNLTRAQADEVRQWLAPLRP